MILSKKSSRLTQWRSFRFWSCETSLGEVLDFGYRKKIYNFELYIDSVEILETEIVLGL